MNIIVVMDMKVRCLCNFGYGGNDCQPICRNCGKNSFCSKPEVCECKLGFARNDSSVSDICHPICDIKCEEHAECVTPGKCECIEGYSTQETKDGCQPICHQKCPENAFCHQPDTCECNLGYIMNEHICEPDCSNKCPENAKCMAPNSCECKPGYEKTNGTEICKPMNLVSSTTEATSTEMVTIPTTDWPKSTMLQRRSISTTTTKIPLTPIPLNNCTSNCQCWTEYDEMGSIPNSKCFDICSKDNQKTRCLNLTNCHCYQENGPISCKDGDEDDSIEELQYICKVKASSVVEKSEKLESQGNLKKLGPKSYWPIIVGIIITIGAIIFAGLAFYFYNKRRLIERHDEPLLEENL
ncbi:uncharacterized protein [Drosophila tropicalis]|uniref:uncharacterized protein n=1 Tax=Drosophila tropicalis TaxID=46794 RepID=UPI0035ABB17E